MSDARSSQDIVLALTHGTTDSRVSQASLLALLQGDAHARVSQIALVLFVPIQHITEEVPETIPLTASIGAAFSCFSAIEDTADLAAMVGVSASYFSGGSDSALWEAEVQTQVAFGVTPEESWAWLEAVAGSVVRSTPGIIILKLELGSDGLTLELVDTVILMAVEDEEIELVLISERFL